jgi:hypothetical protein
MNKDRCTDKVDLFLRGAGLRARQDANARDMHHDAGRARTEAFFEALVASVAVIAHADGRLELAQRRTLVEAFISLAMTVSQSPNSHRNWPSTVGPMVTIPSPPTNGWKSARQAAAACLKALHVKDLCGFGLRLQ